MPGLFRSLKVSYARSLEVSYARSVQVLYSFDAQGQAELSMTDGQTVTLLCPHDRIGCEEWWLVQAGKARGYVPASYLTSSPPTDS